MLCMITVRSEQFLNLYVFFSLDLDFIVYRLLIIILIIIYIIIIGQSDFLSVSRYTGHSRAKRDCEAKIAQSTIHRAEPQLKRDYGS